MLSKIEEILLKFYKEQMIVYVNNNPDSLNELLKLAISDKQPFAWRAAWLLWSCIDKNDFRIQKDINKIIKSLKNKKDGHQRELLKILSVMKLTEKQECIICDISIDIIKDISKNPSVRFTALKFIIEIIKKYPELKNELAFLKEEHFINSFSPGIRNSIIKLNIFFEE